MGRRLAAAIRMGTKRVEKLIAQRSKAAVHTMLLHRKRTQPTARPRTRNAHTHPSTKTGRFLWANFGCGFELFDYIRRAMVAGLQSTIAAAVAIVVNVVQHTNSQPVF